MAARDPKDTLRRLVNLGSAMTGITREDIEGLVREFVDMESERAERAEEFAEEVFARSRRTAERVGTLVRDELRRELDARGRSLGPARDLIDRAVGLLGDLLGAGRPGADVRPSPQDEATPEGQTVTRDNRSPGARAGARSAAKAPAKAAKAPAKAAKAGKTPPKASKSAAGPAPGGPAPRATKTTRAGKTSGATKTTRAGKSAGASRPAGKKGIAS